MEQLQVLGYVLLAGHNVFSYFSHRGKNQLVYFVQGALKHLRTQERFRVIRTLSSLVVTISNELFLLP